ncbi:DNA translocase FtsK [Spiroplasma chinense]|uniref:DNA translocase FtsK n=1 Tax=Spiroplasma chinense TaxID=216932 RepID=UPI001411B705|nr:DNA translocase FtsK [Spiroplasma chinense]
MNNYEDFVGFPVDDNDSDRTRAFELQKKQRRPDSISWIVSALILFFLSVISLGRITVVGQVLDDVIFTLPFGWFKYFLYLLFFVIDFAIYFGIKIKPKKRFIFMIFVTWIVFCWIISSILFIVAHHMKSQSFVVDKVFSKTIFVDTVESYLTHWKRHSFFGDENRNLLISSRESYFTMWAGGGLFGTVLAGISSYTTIYGGLVIALFGFYLNMIWIFTGDPFYLLKPKGKRKGKRLRILSLKSKNQFNIGENKKRSRKGKFFKLIQFDENTTLDNFDVISSIRESDMTIELPSFMKVQEHNVYAPVDAGFYDDNFDIPFENRKPDPFKDVKLEEEKFFGIGNKGYENIGYQSSEPVFYQNEETEIAPNEQFEAMYLPRREQKPENEVPANSLYGKEVSQDEVRKKLEREARITPHGGNGRTREILGEMKSSNFDNTSQLSLEEFISSSNSEINQRNENVQKASDYVSPMEDIFTKTVVNGYGRFTPRNQNTQTIELNHNNATEKELYVNNNYVLPDIEILNKDLNNQKEFEKLKEMAQLKANSIDATFEQFGVKAKVVNMNIGPSVTKFEIQPSPGTKVNSITSLENDLKLALANQHVRIEAPIQGKAAVGIEVPNDNPVIVPIRSVIQNVPIQKLNSKLLFAIGKTVTGEMLFGELDKAPHLLVAGSTGSGKSVMINGIISSILMRAKPHEVKFLMIDPKKVELSTYANIPHLLTPVISDMNLANNALKKVINEMDRRYVLFTKNGVKNIETYNAKIRDDKKKLPFYVIIIDELADLMMTANKKDVEESITRLTQMARAAGIHLIVATQRPSTDVLTGVIKSNIPTRISFAVASAIDSRTILDSSGAEKLIGRGDLLYLPPGSSSLMRAQGVFISDDEIERLVDHCSKQQRQMFDEEFMQMENDNDNGYGDFDEKDELFEEVKDYIIREQKASTSLIQRKFKIGYNRAARIIDELEAMGVIGPQNSTKSRDIYVKKEEIY